MIRYLSQVSAAKLKGTALVRLDFNTADEWRMQAAVPTLRYLIRTRAKVVVVSHKGRPKGIEPALSLKRHARDLQRFLKKDVVFIPHFRFGAIQTQIDRARPGSAFLLENIRFLRGEETPSPELARQLAGLADYYVNDAFAVSHRPADSVARVEKFLPSFAGLELEKEIRFLSHVMTKAKRPLLVIIGGAKAYDKMGILKYFRRKADTFLIGGAAANTLLSLRGVDVKRSMVERDAKVRREVRKALSYKNVILPVDWVMHEGRILDIGPKTAAAYEKKIRAARSILWSGPLGFMEKKPFDRGTLAVARAIAANRKALSVTGGGETVAFLKKHKLDKKFSFISTGGGALLEFLEGKKLPGIEALKRSR